MKSLNIILTAGAFLLFAGCATPPDNTSDVAVRVGMSRGELKMIYGEPLRIDSNPSGGEDWYYHFYAWCKGPAVSASSQTTDAYGNTTSSTSSEPWHLGKGTEDEAIHLSAEGYVVEPLPSGKVLKN